MIKSIFKSSFLSIVILTMTSFFTFGQADSTKEMEAMSLKELLNLKVVSVSKKSENLFDSPLSASVITKEDIRKAGSTSIMEALRLVPGVIVREQSNGNYDIHLRGMDNAPPNTGYSQSTNTTTLVMIDGRSVYNYLQGGTFWETLPVDLNDVERIEVVRGPAAALYGPNAVNGVINILTSRPQKDGLYTVVNSQQGTNHTFINNASVGYQFNKKLNFVASGNYQNRDRSQTSYYEVYRNEWIDKPAYLLTEFGDTMKDIKTRYPEQGLAMEKYAGNIFLNYDPADKVKFSIAAGAQHSMVQDIYYETITTPFTTSVSDSKYADLRANIKGFSTQLSYNKGTQDISLSPGTKYDFNTFDFNAEYSFKIGKLSIKPGLSYGDAVYDDTQYSDTINKTGLFNAKGKITSMAESLSLEYKLFSDKLRLVAAVRNDKFNHPDATYYSYQFAASYKLNDKHLFRAVYSSAPRSPVIYDTYVNQTVYYYPTGLNTYTKYEVMGNTNLKLLTANMFEIGYRGKLSNKCWVDLEMYNTVVKNYSAIIFVATHQEYNGNITIEDNPLITRNLPVELHQQGITLSLNYNLNKLKLKPFVTFQQTKLKNYSRFNNTADSPPSISNLSDPANNNINSGMGAEQLSQSTPSIFGGATLNYMFGSKLNVNLNGYYYSSQTYYNFANLEFNDGIRGVDHINAKLILDSKVSYEVLKRMNIYISLKNILNNTSREFFKADKTPFMILGGANLTF